MNGKFKTCFVYLLLILFGMLSLAGRGHAKSVSIEPLFSPAELAHSMPPDATTVRSLDLLLQHYDSRGQTLLVYRVCREVLDEYPDTVYATWCRAWDLWLLREISVEDDGNPALKDGLRDAAGSHAEIFLSAAETWPEDLTGALALRLLLLADEQTIPVEQGRDWANLKENLRLRHPESGAVALLQMDDASRAADAGRWPEAAQGILATLEHYPFRDEVPEWRRKAADALAAMGETDRGPWLQNGEIGGGRGQVYLDVLRGRSLLGGANHRQGLALLKKARDELAGTIHGQEMLEEVEFHLYRESEGPELETARARLRQIQGSAIAGIPGQVSNLEPELLQQVGFTRALIHLLRQRFAGSLYPDEKQAWEHLATHEAAAPEARLRAWTLLLEGALRRLPLLTVALENNESNLVPVTRVLHRQLAEEEALLMESLVPATETIRSMPVQSASLELADAIHRANLVLGFRNEPADLYVDLARRSTPALRRELARRAELLGLFGQQARILANELSDTNNLEAGSEADLRDLIVALERNGEFREAARKAEELANRHPADHPDAWQEAVRLYRKAYDYSEAARILDSLGAEGLEQEPADPAQQLEQAHTYLEARDYEQFDALKSAVQSRDLQPEALSRLTELEARSFLYRRRYGEAVPVLERLLAWNELSPEKRTRYEGILVRIRQNQPGVDQ